MMMNFVALSLLFSSLAAAGIFSPRQPEPKFNQQQQDLNQNDPVVREGHRLLVVEYERRSSDQAPHRRSVLANEFVEEAKEKFQEAAALIPNVGQGVPTPAPAELEEPRKASKNVICDAYGKCKETISFLVGKGKEKTAEMACEVKGAAKEAAEEGKEMAGEFKGAAKEAAEEGKEMAGEFMEEAKDAVKGAAKKAGEKAGKIKEAAKQKGEEIAGDVSTIAEKAMDKAEQKKKEVRRNLTDILHRARDVAYDAAAYVSAPEIGRVAAAIMHLVGLATAYGTCVWVTFVSSHVLATALPRQQFGAVQSKLYPVYFRAVGYGISFAILGQFFGRRTLAGGEKMQGFNLIGALVLVLINLLYLEPKATKVMYERMKMEKEEGRGRDMADIAGVAAPDTYVFATSTNGEKAAEKAAAVAAAEQEAAKSRMVMVSKKLKRLNNYSSLLNILTLMSLTWHLVHLSKGLNCRTSF